MRRLILGSMYEPIKRPAMLQLLQKIQMSCLYLSRHMLKGGIFPGETIINIDELF